MTNKLKRLIRQTLRFYKFPWYLKTRRKFIKQWKKSEFKRYNPIIKTNIFLSDIDEQAGSITSYYFYQDLWASKKIFQRNPSVHYDIGSRIDGFIAQLLSQLRKVILIDVRPLDSHTKIDENLSFIQGDAISLKNIADDSIDSISALCSIEHFGLGRYGDPVDPDACFKAFKEFQRVVRKNGHIYISLPVSASPCVEFNAHRVFNPKDVIECFNNAHLLEFSVIFGGGIINKTDDINEYKHSECLCGLFEFTKD